ncbi:protein kinase domain-containing protein, partial [Streptomyces europaeiscabiei]
MGRVYLARSPQGRTVAVKAIRPELMGDKNFRIRFRREVEAAGAVGGRYTAPVVDADPEGAIPWLATDYIAGPTLAEAIAAHGPLPAESVLVLGAGIAEALISVQAAGLVHRDLKPSNVLLAADGPRVIDFGIVRASDGYDLTRSGALFGSFEYMCPEQATGEPLGPEGDVFSLGSVLTFAAAGHAPFSGTAAATLLYQVVHSAPDLTGVPEPLDKIISLCLTKDPRLRITPDKLAAACAPGGVEQLTGDGWLPPSVTSSIALRAAAVQTLDAAPNTPVAFPMTGTGPESAAYGFQQERPAYRSQRDGAAYASRQSRVAYDFEHEAPGPPQTPSASGSGRPYDGSGHPGRQREVPPPGGADGEQPGSGHHSRTEPSSAPEEPEPYRPSSAGHRRTVPRPGPSRRTVLTVSAGSAA